MCVGVRVLGVCVCVWACVSVSGVAILAQRFASADGEVFDSLLFVSETLRHATPRMVWVPSDSLSAPKVRGLAKGTQNFLVAFCTLAVATGNPSQGFDRSKFPDDGTVGSQVVPDKIQTKWWPMQSRERSGCRVGVCNCGRAGCSVAASSARSSNTAIGSAIRRVSGLHQAFPEQVVPFGARTHRRTRSSGRRIGTVSRIGQEMLPTENVVLVTIPNGAEDPGSIYIVSVSVNVKI